MRPKVFVGSSKEGKRFADAVVAGLGSDVNCHPWYQGVFEISGNTLDSQLRELSHCDFAIIILTADDSTTSQGHEYFTPRDNLVFEAGLSFGLVHPTRTFLIPEKKPEFKLPTDLSGFTVTEGFNSLEAPREAVMAAVTQIRLRIQELGRKPTRHHNGIQEKLAAATINLIKSADHTVVLFGRDLSWAPLYADIIRDKVSANVHVEVFSDKESRRKARGNAALLSKAGAKVYYCELDPGIKLTMVDHDTPSVCQFMISFKERNPSYSEGNNATDRFVYRYTIHDAQYEPALWPTLVRLYNSLKHESRRRQPTVKRKPRNSVKK